VAADRKAAAETRSVPDFSDSVPVSEEPFSFKACSEVSREVLVDTGETTSPRFKEDFSTLEAAEGADMDVDIPEAVVIQEATQANILSEEALAADILMEVASEEAIQVPILTREGLVEVILKGAASEEAIQVNIPVDLEVDTKDKEVSVEATHKGVALEVGIPEATQEVTQVATQVVPEVLATEVRMNRSSSEVQARQEVFQPVEKRSQKEVQSRLVNDVNRR
jgi:hypothetical protein